MNKLVTYILIIIGFISSRMSIQRRKGFGIVIGNILRKLSAKREKITFNNLKNAFPDKSDEWLNGIVKKSYHNLGIVLAEVTALKHLSEEDMHDSISFENIELLENVYSRGKGLILLSGHFGNWEYLAYSGGLFSKIPILVIVKPQQNVFADKMLNRYRTQAGNEVVSMFSAARKIIAHLKGGKAVALLADQSAFGGKDVFVDFFGRPAATFESPAALALKYDVPIVYGFAVRNHEGVYSVKLDELKFDDLKNDEAGIKELTKRHVSVLENAVREHPDHWAWQHRRWKHQPEKK
ncbi:lysophospholipid acyltransferase family protein [Bacteroidota bacterium]